MKYFHKITLEISLKPFYDNTPAGIARIAERIFSDWKPLLEEREIISILLWSADGSELLDYDGTLDTPFEWGKYLGTANRPILGEDEPKETNLHHRKQLYRPDPPIFTYRILKQVVSTLKTVGQRHFPKARIRVGTTFDIGPEFAVSDFKYRRHPEIATGSVIDLCGFIDATAELHADTRRYAAYPNGIPQGEPFGRFLGKQSARFLPDMGFDYLWLSNGLGFSAEPWRKTGKIFDGESYHPQRLAQTSRRVFDFWRLFRAVCPDIPLEVRGTNLSAGMDYATDGVPLYDIYRADLGISPPPNSPWAAINDDYGLEMAGHMSRICELPGQELLFRYYLHDPWWVNSPWYDRYDGAPGDIYLPMSVGRIDQNGRVHGANALAILSIDNSYGEMPKACVYEPLPHILKAEKDAPDAPSPIVWVYPLREFTRATEAWQLREMNTTDSFIAAAINDGTPLSTVVSTDNFLVTSPVLYEGRICLSPVPFRQEVREALYRHAAHGGTIFYGSEELLSTLPEAQGVLKVVASKPADLRAALEGLGFCVRFVLPREAPKPPALSIAASDGALFFSVYNPCTVSEAQFYFSIGAPILLGCETQMKEGFSCYRFSRGEHRECRLFVKQREGVLSAKEAPPVNARYRRRIVLRGLRDATVRFYPEHGYAEGSVAADAIQRSDSDVPQDTRFVLREDAYGPYLYAEHITGDIYFLLERKQKEHG